MALAFGWLPADMRALEVDDFCDFHKAACERQKQDRLARGYRFR